MDTKQIVVINYKKYIGALGGITFLFGIISLSITLYYNNNQSSLLDKKCPAFNGKFYNFASTSAYLLIITGAFGLTCSAVIPRLMVIIKRPEVAIFLGHAFMGIAGQVLQVAFTIGLIANNISGSLTISKHYKSVKPTNTENPEAYCHSTILNLALVLNGLVYILSFIQLVLSGLTCKKAHKKTNLAQKNFHQGSQQRSRHRPSARFGGLERLSKETHGLSEDVATDIDDEKYDTDSGINNTNNINLFHFFTLICFPISEVCSAFA